MTDSDGGIVWRARVQLWGNIRFEENRDIYSVHPQQNLRFAGQYLDRETGLHYNTFRYFLPESGRFSQPDPAGLAGGINLYQYAPNPLGWIDPLGLTRTCSFKNPPKQPFSKAVLNAMNKAINDILSGKGIPRLDMGKQKIFQGKGKNAGWAGAKEWEVIKGNNDMRVLTLDLGDGKTKIGFSPDHYERIFEIIISDG
ncbi:RHS repeat domain-containing protein, partial [Escherichia fergusonii]